MKKILAALLATAMTLSLAACGGGASSNKPAGSNPPAASTPAPSNGGDKVTLNVIISQ